MTGRATCASGQEDFKARQGLLGFLEKDLPLLILLHLPLKFGILPLRPH